MFRFGFRFGRLRFILARLMGGGGNSTNTLPELTAVTADKVKSASVLSKTTLTDAQLYGLLNNFKV